MYDHKLELVDSLIDKPVVSIIETTLDIIKML